MTSQALAAPALEEVRAARQRIADHVLRTPLLRLDVDAPAEIHLKLENLQPIGSFKLRGAMNAIRRLANAAPERMRNGVYTASAGNMAQGLAWGARSLAIPCTVIVPEHAPRAKTDAVERLGARVERVPFDDWWQVLVDHGRHSMPGLFVHPFADRDVMAGNGTIAEEILEELSGIDTILVPYGGGGLACGIAATAKALRSDIRVLACEVATAAPFAAARTAGEPVSTSYSASFVDGIGAKRVADEIWPLANTLLDDSITVSLEEVAAAIRLLVERARVVAEGAGATPVAAALTGRSPGRRIVCVVSGGNIDPAVLARILAGETPLRTRRSPR